jgi:hypothetical protein
MRWHGINMLVGIGALFLGVGVQQEQPPEPPVDRVRNLANVQVGMTAEAVRKQLGRPSRRSRQILYRRFVEQWRYDDPAGLWIEFDCLKGQEPKVLAVHPPAP